MARSGHATPSACSTRQASSTTPRGVRRGSRRHARSVARWEFSLARFSSPPHARLVPCVQQSCATAPGTAPAPPRSSEACRLSTAFKHQADARLPRSMYTSSTSCAASPLLLSRQRQKSRPARLWLEAPSHTRPAARRTSQSRDTAAWLLLCGPGLLEPHRGATQTLPAPPPFLSRTLFGHPDLALWLVPAIILQRSWAIRARRAERCARALGVAPAEPVVPSILKHR